MIYNGISSEIIISWESKAFLKMESGVWTRFWQITKSKSSMISVSYAIYKAPNMLLFFNQHNNWSYNLIPRKILFNLKKNQKGISFSHCVISERNYYCAAGNKSFLKPLSGLPQIRVQCLIFQCKHITMDLFNISRKWS